MIVVLNQFRGMIYHPGTEGISILSFPLASENVTFRKTVISSS
jgi:hypothetical protein